MKKIEMQIKEFLNFRSCCEQFRITFDYWVKPGGLYIVEAKEKELEIIGY